MGTAEGFVDFVEDDPNYQVAVSPEIRAKQHQVITQIREGALSGNN
jgi:hypothetical protein